MPVIHVHMLSGRSLEQKRRLVSALTEAIVRETGVRAEGVTVIIHDTGKDNWGHAGQLVKDSEGS